MITIVEERWDLSAYVGGITDDPSEENHQNCYWRDKELPAEISKYG